MLNTSEFGGLAVETERREDTSTHNQIWGQVQRFARQELAAWSYCCAGGGPIISCSARMSLALSCSLLGASRNTVAPYRCRGTHSAGERGGGMGLQARVAKVRFACEGLFPKSSQLHKHSECRTSL